MNKKILLIFFILISSSILDVMGVSAQTFINIYIDETGNAVFLGETNQQIELPEGIKIENQEIIGETRNLTSKQGELWTFEYSLDDSEINLILPKGAVIKELTEGEIGIEDNQISIYVGESISVSYIIEEQKESFNWIILIGIIGLILFIIILFVYLKLKNRKKEKDKAKTKKAKKPDKLEIIKDMLNEREKLIIERLKEKKQIKSSILRKLCDIPKASFSRHTQELEKKGLIKRTGERKNKIISLK